MIGGLVAVFPFGLYPGGVLLVDFLLGIVLLAFIHRIFTEVFKLPLRTSKLS